jgi:hypothetical protein
MASDLETARDDLAYMRSLVSGSGPMQATMGEVFVWAGALYGVQCLLHWLQTLHLAPEEGLGALAIVVVPTVVFCLVLGWVIWKDRKAPPAGAVSRALTAVFQGAGLANLVMAMVFAFGLWLYHPIVVCMFQGVAWYVAWVILKRAWLAAVAFGWFATTLTLGVTVFGDIGVYLLTLGVALIAFMAVPGWVIWRGAKKAA